MSSTASCSSADYSYDSDEPPELELDLLQLKLIASEVFSLPCTVIRKLTRGRYHEIFLLSFDKDVSPSLDKPSACIARFPRNLESPTLTHSTITTMRYVDQRTKIPVPKIYHISTEHESTSVGVPFVFMERMPGVPLHKFWNTVDITEKLSVVRQIAGVIAELGSLEFEQIGTLAESDTGDAVILHGIENRTTPGGRKVEGPWATVEDWLTSFIIDETISTSSSHLENIGSKLRMFLMSRPHDLSLKPPFGLLHTDFDTQNILFTQPPNAKLTAVIDWDKSHTAPRYFIYDFPIFLQNDPYHKDDWAINRTLRRELVSSTLQYLKEREKDDSQVAVAKECFSGKSYFINRFVSVFMTLEMPLDENEKKEWALMREILVKHFSEDLEKERRKSYEAEWYQEEDYRFDEVGKGSSAS